MPGEEHLNLSERVPLTQTLDLQAFRRAEAELMELTAVCVFCSLTVTSPFQPAGGAAQLKNNVIKKTFILAQN